MLMKTAIHPQYHPQAKITCACGNKIIVGSTKDNIKIDICSQCHPFYTGKKKVVDAVGKVEKFKSRRSKAISKTRSKTEKKSAKKTKKAEKTAKASAKPLATK